MRVLFSGFLVVLCSIAPSMGFQIEVVSYSSSVPPSETYPDTGGNELTDGEGKTMDVWPNATDPAPLVGWTDVDPEITFNFSYPIQVGTIKLYLANSAGAEGVALPQTITVKTDTGFELPVEITTSPELFAEILGTEVQKPGGSGSIVELALEGRSMNTYTDTITLKLSRSELGSTIGLSEVVFETSLKADMTMDITGTIAQPDTAEIDDPSRIDEKAVALLRVHRTTREKREGIMVRIGGFGADEPEGGRHVELPPAKVRDKDGELVSNTDAPNYEWARDELGFDIYTVDWYDGTNYIQKNAMVLVELIQRIRNGTLLGNDGTTSPQAEVPLQEGEKLVLVPASMGGLVSRYALAFMETEGIEHGVDLWMTFDTPHAGAYIPIGIQHLVEFLRTFQFNLFNEQLQASVDLVNSPAARQMLLLHHTASGEAGDPIYNELHKSFFDELRDDYGNYPQDPTLRKVAMSNGRKDGINTIWKDGKDNDTQLAPTSPRRILKFDRSITIAKGTYDADYKVGDRVLWEREVDWKVKVGIILEAWTPNPTGINSNVFRARFVRKLFVFDEEVKLDSSVIREHLFNVLDIPEFVSGRAVENVISFLISAAYDFQLPPIASAQVEADYVYDFLPGGLSARIKEAAEAISASTDTPRHCFIPATSSVGIIENYNRALEEISAADTPFDAIYFEKSENANHVFFNGSNGRPAFEKEVSRILDAPTIFATIPESIPEGARDTLIILKGVHFTEDTEVLWDGSPRPTTYVSETELRITAPEEDLETSATVQLSLKDPISEYTGLVKNPFEILPIQIQVTPSNFGPGDLVKFRYDGLWRDNAIPANPEVSINGNTVNILATAPVQIAIQVFTPYQIEAELGRLPAGSYTIIYSVKDGLGTNEVDRQTVNLELATPTISSVSPSEMDVHGEPFLFEMIGSGFFTGEDVPEAERTEVRWNGVLVPADALSREFFQVEIPSNAPIAALNTLEIFNPSPGGGTASIEIPYTGAVITSSLLKHDNTSENDVQRVHVNGEGLISGSTIYWNGEPLETTESPEGEFSAIIPAESARALGDGVVTLVDPEGLSTPIFLTQKIPPRNVLLVKKETPDGNDGLSWDTAFDSLAAALDAAEAGNEIWVAAGVYPVGFFDPATGFELVDGVAVLGGFAGIEVSSDQRNSDPSTNNTILSGDRLEDDGNFGLGGDNAAHVVNGINLSDTTVLDGFTIQGGNAISSENQGGGIKLVNSSPLLQNLIIEGNIAISGGGIYSEGGNPTLREVMIRSNSANGGGGIFISGGSPHLDRIFVLGNRAQDGAGIYVGNSASPLITHSVIAGNDGPIGAGLLNFDSAPRLNFVTISGNSGGARGGGMHNINANPFVENCIIWANTAPIDPGISGTALDPLSNNNTIQDGHSTGTNISDADPLFLRLADSGEDGKWYPDIGDNNYGNFRLLEDSPSVDQGAYVGTFKSFATAHPTLDPEEDANGDGISNVVAYLLGLNPETSSEALPGIRLERLPDGVTFEIVSRTSDGEYNLLNQLSVDLETWYALEEGEDIDYELQSTEELPNGLTRARGLFLLQFSPLGETLFLQSQSQSRSPWDNLRSDLSLSEAP